MLRSSVRRERAFIRMWWAVQGAVTAGSVLALVVSAVLVANGAITVGTAFLLFQYVLLIVAPAGGPRPPAGDGAEGERGDGARHRPARRRADDRRRRHDVAAAGRARRRVPRRRRSHYGDDGRRRRRADDPPRRRPRHRRRPLGRRRRPDRQRQDDVLPPAAAPRRGDDGHGRRSAACRSPTSRWPSCAGASPSCRRRSSCSRARSATTSRCSTRRRPTRRSIDALARAGLGALAAAGIHRALGAGGAGLSAGEAQLLALARVWLRQPDLVVLDEATARIDPVTEQRLEAAVAQLIAGRTTLDHRPQAVDAADGRRGHRVRPRPHRRARRPRGARPPGRQPLAPPARAGARRSTRSQRAGCEP